MPIKKKLEKFRLSDIQTHPLQPRADLDGRAFVELVYSMVTRGYDPSKPLVVHKTFEADSPVVYLLDGNRRRLCYLFSRGYIAWIEEESEDELPATWPGDPDYAEWYTLELVESYCSEFAVESGSFEHAFDRLIADHDTEFEVSVFQGNDKDAVLFLQAANHFREDNDELGEARSFYQSIESGVVTAAEIAQNVGYTLRRTESLIALGYVYDKFFDLCMLMMDTATPTPLKAARLFADIPEDYQSAVAEFIVTNKHMHKLEQISELLQPPTQTPMFDSALTSNLYQSFQQAFKQVPAGVYARAICRMTHAVNKTGTPDFQWPWQAYSHTVYNRPLFLESWFSYLDLEQYLKREDDYRISSVDWNGFAQEFLPDHISCVTCPLSKLSGALQQPNDFPLYPCRTETEFPGKCIYGLREGATPTVILTYYPDMDFVGQHRKTYVNNLPIATGSEMIQEYIDHLTAPEQEESTVSEPVEARSLTNSDSAGVTIINAPDRYRSGYQHFVDTRLAHTGVAAPLSTDCTRCAYHTAAGKCEAPAYEPPTQYLLRSNKGEYEIPFCTDFVPIGFISLNPDQVPDVPETTISTEALISVCTSMLDMLGLPVRYQSLLAVRLLRFGQSWTSAVSSFIHSASRATLIYLWFSLMFESEYVVTGNIRTFHHSTRQLLLFSVEPYPQAEDIE